MHYDKTGRHGHQHQREGGKPVRPRNLPRGLLACALLLAAGTAGADPVRFAEFLDVAERHHPGLAAQREAVRGAQAGIDIAGVRPDPVLTYGRGGIELSRAVSPRPPRTHEFGVEMPLELGGKRAARMRAAASNLRLAQAGEQGFRNTLYAESAADFIEACRSREVLARQESALAALARVVRANETRRAAGDIGGLELAQSRVARDRFAAGVTAARAAARAALEALSVRLGMRVEEAFGEAPLACDFRADDPGTDAGALVARALEKRDEVRIARAALDHARDNAALARANRWVDPSVSLGLTLTPGTPGSPDGGGTPRSRMLGVSVSVPLPLSRLQRGELTQAESDVTQAMLALREAELKTAAEVRRALLAFAAARDNFLRYRDAVSADADRVLDGMRQSYHQGAAPLLALLDAQRTADETYLDYLQSRADLAGATVALQLATGLRPSL
ncbi:MULTISPECIES: TolC family protein [Cupriavidus]